ncbi:hypothetical protein Entas_2702 [Enterobacter soli]|nr:hypothetical protein Entas_2702 [Enterobacter soli]
MKDNCFNVVLTGEIMFKLINFAIRLAALMSVVSLISMVVGWQNRDLIAISIDLIMIIIWLSHEFDMKKKNRI